MNQINRIRTIEVTKDIYAVITPAAGLDITDAGMMDNFSNSAYINRGEGLICDTFFDLPHARDLRDFCVKQSGHAPKYVINTHGHWDHFWGNQVNFDKLGIKGSPTAELVFNNAPALLIGDRRMGLIKYVMSLMNGARLGVGAQSVGLAEAAYREALEYAKQREQFGKAIIRFPQVYEMLGTMKAKIDATRSLLYETTRFVDLYKTYDSISKERQLTSEERQDMKYSQRCADMMTPMLKLFASEYANQVAYDSIQVHGGSGFMKEYKCERLYRDARILSIYEGTSQLQVVAAIRFIGNGAYLKRIEEYEAMPLDESLMPLRSRIDKMKESYLKIVETADKFGTTSEAYDFLARRMVEAMGHLIMSHLLLQDCNRSMESGNCNFMNSCKIMIALGEAEIAKILTFVENFKEEDLQMYN